MMTEYFEAKNIKVQELFLLQFLATLLYKCFLPVLLRVLHLVLSLLLQIYVRSFSQMPLEVKMKCF